MIITVPAGFLIFYIFSGYVS